MATECPIRMIERAYIWQVSKKSTRYKSSSGRFLLEDLDFLLQSDVMPCRSESAPPTIEGSMAAITNISSNLNHDEVSANVHHSHVDASSRLTINNLLVHAEESEDDRSSVRSDSVAGEKATVLTTTPFHTKKEDSYCSSSPSDDQNKSKQGTFVLDADSHVHKLSYVGMNTSCSFNISQISSVEGSREVAVWPDVSNSDFQNLHEKRQQSSPQNNMLQPGVAPREVQGSYPRIIYPGITSAYGNSNQLQNSSSGIPVTNFQPICHASGYMPPLYANASALMASSSLYYPYMQPRSYVAPVYMGGFNFNPALFPNACDIQSFPKYYAPTYPSPSMHYFQPYLRDPSGHFSHQAPSDIAVANQMNSFNGKKSSDSVGVSSSYKSPDTSYSNVGSRRRNSTSHYNSGSTKVTKHVSGKTNFSEGRHHMSNVHSFEGNRINSIECDGLNSYYFLEEIKSGKGSRFDLSDIAGHIVEFSVDQHGSRFIQQKLEVCSIQEKESLLKEIILHAPKLMTDVFGNYVIQKVFEYGSTDQIKCLTDQLEGQILPLSLQMYGCRVIQKALEVIDLEEKTRLVRELDGHVMKCVYDQNGNHVIQKCIESIPTERIHFIVSSFRGHVESLSMHPYGCRVIQRVLEHCSHYKQTQFIVDEILDSVCTLAQDQYGNYVTQQVLVKGNPHERKEISVKLAGSVVQLSQHKFASNVIEKCIELSDSTTRELLIRNIVGDDANKDNLLIMMKDQFGNYVVQRIVEKCCSEQRNLVVRMIRNNLNSLKKYTYGKHIAARFERLCDHGYFHHQN